MNQIIMRGRCTADPFTSYGKDGKAVSMITLCVPDRSMPRDSKGDYPVDYIRCVAFNGLAGVIEKYCEKGTELIVSGKISSSSFEKNGEMQYVTEVIINDMEFGSNKKNEASDKTKTGKKTA